jgi:amino acid adenylation domain-containing protein
MSMTTETEGRIAIIGLSGRFPGAQDVAAFWRNLRDGVESVTFFADDQLEDGADPATRASAGYVKARPVLADVDQFDAGFFDMREREAALTDPQHRVFLECAWEALEDAGYDPGAYRGTICVFAGCSMNTYFLNNICRDRKAIEDFTGTFQVGDYPVLIGAGREFLASRVSYKLDLRGPSLTIQTACSTSLVAVAQACQSLLLYQADMALAGGVSISFPQYRGYLHQEGGMVSVDGHCRPFDASASGTIFGSGAGVVVLKRLEDAIADGDQIYGVILGCGLSNDGAGKVGFTAPSIDGQVAAIEQALAQAGIPADSVGYVECHGTATPLGDPIEIAALTKAFRRSTLAQGYCAIGSVKGNIGHLDAAAGVAGLIKTALMLRNRELVPSLHFEAPNPRIAFEGGPFFVNAMRMAWRQDAEPRRAGVTSLGVGGTNAHVIVEEAPTRASARLPLGPELLVLAARSPSALAQIRARLADHLAAHPDVLLSDIAFTLQRGRRHFRHRLAVACRDDADAQALLSGASSPRLNQGEAAAAPPSVVFMFPGQGAQYVGMARGLYRRFPAFRAELDRCAQILSAEGIDLIEALYGRDDPSQPERLARTGAAQPAIFSVSYALARLWQSWGVNPAACIGHSVGEFVAAHLAGVFSLPDALHLIALRGRLMQALPPGDMLSVRLSEAEVQPLIGDGVALAAINSPTNVVLAGPHEALDAVMRQLDARGVPHQRLHTSHAFHSPMMEPMIGPFMERVADVALYEPSTQYISSVSGDWIRTDEATSPAYWARHAREPVRFADGIKMLTASAPSILLEVGPGATLSTLALQTARDLVGRTFGSLPEASAPTADEETMLSALGKLWVNGIAPDWASVADGSRSRVSLPTYPFERRRHWIEAPPRQALGSGERDGMPVFSPTSAGTRTGATIAAVLPDVFEQAQDLVAEMDGIREGVVEILQDVSGETIDPAAAATLLELGFDSLLLSQVAQQIQRKFNVKIAFRQLFGELSTIPALERFVRAEAPAAAERPVPAPVTAVTMPVTTSAHATTMVPTASASLDGTDPGIAAIMRAQVEAMSSLIQRQLDTLKGLGLSGGAIAAPGPAVAAVAPLPAAQPAAAPAASSEAEQRPSRFQAYRTGVKRADSGVSPEQKRHIDALTARVTGKSGTSKQRTAAARPVLADPRAAAGFRPEWKDLVYPLICVRSSGSRIWDIDGNEYIDLVNGYGPTALGHSPDFVVEAIKEQLEKGFATGPQAELAGEVAMLFAEMTGNERMTFCNTGSEAVMAAFRVARAVTGRNKVVMFNGAYHGQFDEVLVRSARRPGGPPRSAPIAAGIPQSAVENIVVLDYGALESLDWIRHNAEDVAAVIVEPVQSRHPNLQPFEFLHTLRQITADAEIAFVMDEIVTGFRTHPGGMQAVLGIRADLATYGKVIGGGLPIGILAGSEKFMDALDGGQWNYGDDSLPEVAPTFFAGTFVRHPLVLAAVRAVLRHLKAQGPLLQEHVAEKAANLAERLKGIFARHGLKAEAEHFSSFLYFSLHADGPLAGLLFYHLRDRGIYVQDGFPLFLNAAHTAEDIARIAAAFDDSLDEMARAGIFGVETAAPASESAMEPLGAVAPLTESQLEIWLSAQNGDEASCAFNESVTLRLNGPLDLAALRKAMDAVTARHDALRARFSATGETMTISPDTSFPCPFTDATLGDGSLEGILTAYLQGDASTPFDLVEGPPIRARLFKLSETAHALALTAHHIICDGWSVNVIITELAEIYGALREQRRPDLGPVLSFSAYARAKSAAGPDEKAETYWAAQYATPAKPIDLPMDRPRPAVKSYAGATIGHRIDAELYRAVKAAGAKHGCSLFVTLLAGFEALMGRLAGVEELVVAVPTAGQSLIKDQALVGHCVNFLPMRGVWGRETSFLDHLHSVSRQVLDAYEYQDATLGTIVQKLALSREANRLPLTELQFNLERLASRIEVGGLAIDVEPNAKAFVNYDIFWNVIESPAGLRIDCDYNTDLFDKATIEQWLLCYEALLRALVSDLNERVVRIPYIPRVQLQIVEGFNASGVDYPREQCVHALIEHQARATPDAAALAFDGATVGYRDLDERANQLAHHLRARIGSDGGRVGVLVERSPDMVIALLAIWKAGFAYVPLDPAYPQARLRYILSNAGISGVVTGGLSAELTLPQDVAVIDLGRERQAIEGRSALTPAADTRAEATAYLIYTSGSTGAPKGVEVTHRSLVNLLCSVADRPGIGRTDTLLAVTTIAFDIAALELFAPLLAGGTVAIARREDVLDGNRLLAALSHRPATILQATPASWRLLLEAGFRSWPGFKMMCGGEALPRDLANRLLEGGGALWNMYGPTETTVWSSCGEVPSGNDPITIGRPIANTQLHVLDQYDQPVPFGVPGQLHIGGEGVANGYFKQDALTAEKFIPDPFKISRRLYRTGDVARRLPSGEIQVLGRADTQIKLRGFRIELEEIEAVLSRYVGPAAVALREDTVGKPILVGYLAGASAEATSDVVVRTRVAEDLPEYMIPSVWVRLDSLPVTPNGKLDRAALPAPDVSATEEKAFAAPETPLEASLASIWAEVLKVDRVSRDSDLFSLGADSIHLFQIAARANRQGIHLSVRQMLDHRTIAALAAALVTEGGSPSAATESRGQLRRLFPHGAKGRAAT